MLITNDARSIYCSYNLLNLPSLILASNSVVEGKLCIIIIMKHFIYILIGFFLLCLTATTSFAQTDAFKSKSKKGPNIYSPKKKGGKSRTKQYQQSTSKKKSNRKNATFSSSKKRYGSTVGGGKGSGKKGDGGASGGRKSNKGRKKEK